MDGSCLKMLDLIRGQSRNDRRHPAQSSLKLHHCKGLYGYLKQFLPSIDYRKQEMSGGCIEKLGKYTEIDIAQ